MVIVLLLNSIKIIRIYLFLDRFILRTYRKVRNKLLPFLSALVSRNKTKTIVRFRFNFSVQLSIPTWVLVVKAKPKVVQVNFVINTKKMRDWCLSIIVNSILMQHGSCSQRKKLHVVNTPTFKEQGLQIYL